MVLWGNYSGLKNSVISSLSLEQDCRIEELIPDESSKPLEKAHPTPDH